jgi:hypothetical protein
LTGFQQKPGGDISLKVFMNLSRLPDFCTLQQSNKYASIRQCFFQSLTGLFAHHCVIQRKIPPHSFAFFFFDSGTKVGLTKVKEEKQPLTG